MTLVIARKMNNVISFASDSRIDFQGSGYIDFGIKIFSVPAKIYSPTDSVSGNTQVLYDQRIGLAVIGSSINAYTVKDSVYEFLQNLQALPGYTDLSFENISRLAFKVYEKTTEELRVILGRNGFSQLLFGGYCVVSKRVRVFEFSPDLTKSPITLGRREILIDDGIEFYGSGKDVARIMHSQNLDYNSLQIVRDVIKKGTVITVGGGLQYGEFQGAQFRIFGVTDYDLYEDGTFKGYKNTLRGITLYEDEFQRESDGFHISYSFKQPFQGEIDKLLSKFD
jgi:hypothetical protein